MGITCYDVYPQDKNINKMRRILVDRHGFTEKKNHIGPYFSIEAPGLDSWQIKTILQMHGYKYRAYDKRYERASNYRKIYFENNKGPYRCSYCGKHLRADKLEVDHLIPVAKAKSESGVRMLLQICGVRNVNDAKNLVSACHKCNNKKSDKMGLWVVRGVIGRHKSVWAIRDIAVFILVAFAALCVYANFAALKELVQVIIALIQYLQI
jgi:5-methylcytosine-specific restriction endonuclease McrA